MSAGRLGYPNVNIGRYSNEQNIQNMNAFMCELSDTVNHYIGTLEEEIETLKSEIETLKKG